VAVFQPMRILTLSFLAAALSLDSTMTLAAERVFSFASTKVNETPIGFRSTVAGGGPPGEWKIVFDEVSSWLAPLTTRAALEKQPVLAQLSRDRTDERFPMLIFDEEVFGDFRFTTKFKLVDGDVEQMAGIAFRIQDEKNYYYIRASGLGNTFYFYVVTDGRRSPPIGKKMEIAKRAWHELAVECKGNEIHAYLNGQPALPPLHDGTFSSGKVGFWTKSDAVTYFANARISYTPKQSLAEVLVRDAMTKYPRLRGLKIIARGPQSTTPVILASADPADVGNVADKEAVDTVDHGTIYYGKSSRVVTVTLPLHDSNGEPVAAVRVSMKPFPGQTEKNAIVRATPIVKSMEARVRLAQDLIR
jgi:hypothetical protein